MSDCLPDFPRYICQRGNEWLGADHPNGPWRPIPAPQSGLPWPVPPATEESSAPQPTSAAQVIAKAFDDRYELLGPLEDDWQEQCLSAAIRELAEQVDLTREPYGQLLAIAAELEV